MTVEYWIEKNVPKKDTISRDAVEILIKLAWEAAVKSTLCEVEIKKRGPVGPYEIE